MKIRVSRNRWLTVALVVCCLAGAAIADTIRLKDGSVVKGRITSFGDGKFVVTIGDGSRRKQLSFGADEVDSIQFEPIAAPPPINTGVSYNPPPFRPEKPVSQTVIISDTLKKEPAAKSTSRTSLPPNPGPASAPVRSGVKPIEIAVRVLADNTTNGWTNSGWVVKKGQRIKVSADGEISLGGGRKSTPSGSFDIDDTSKLLPSVPTGALIAVVGDDNNDFIYIGSGRTFTAQRDGALFFGVNEGNLNDNTGNFSVKVEIDPASGS